MNIQSYKANNTKALRNQKVSFVGSAASAVGKKVDEFEVINMTLLKKAVPTISFVGSIMAALGYMTGSLGLFYDLKVQKDRGEKPQVHLDKDGAKTIEPKTEIGKNCVKLAKVGLFGSSLAGITCGIGEGLPMMTIGNTTEAFSVPIIETPIGTGLFGLAIASIFAALALDNTPEKKLNHFKLMAAKNAGEKVKIVADNIGTSLKEVWHSVVDVGKNCHKSTFWKENFIHFTPKHVVFEESINKLGKSTLKAVLRHNRNYTMHIASFILGIGGISLALTKAFEIKKAQRNCLRTEEAGFLLDNVGMTRYGLDKFSTGKTAAGANFAIGGVINAVSQFMGLDNQDGRAVQWFGIAMVFAGYAVDRGKFMIAQFKDAKKRPELTDVLRQWKFDISSIIPDKAEAKKFITQMQKGEDATSPEFKKLQEMLEKAIAQANEALKNEIARRVTSKEKAMELKEEQEFSKNKVAEILNTAFDVNGKKAPSIAELNQLDKLLVMGDRLVVCSEKVFGKVPKLVK